MFTFGFFSLSIRWNREKKQLQQMKCSKKIEMNETKHTHIICTHKAKRKINCGLRFD